MSQIWILTILFSTCTLLVENSTPIVVLESWLKRLRVKRDSRFVLPTPESPSVKKTYQHDLEQVVVIITVLVHSQ